MKINVKTLSKIQNINPWVFHFRSRASNSENGVKFHLLTHSLLRWFIHSMKPINAVCSEQWSKPHIPSIQIDKYNAESNKQLSEHHAEIFIKNDDGKYKVKNYWKDRRITIKQIEQGEQVSHDHRSSYITETCKSDRSIPWERRKSNSPRQPLKLIVSHIRPFAQLWQSISNGQISRREYFCGGNNQFMTHLV